MSAMAFVCKNQKPLAEMIEDESLDNAILYAKLKGYRSFP